MTATQMAIMIELQTGWMGSHTKLVIALPDRDEYADGPGHHVPGEDPQAAEEHEDADDQVDPTPLGHIELEDRILADDELLVIGNGGDAGQALEDADHHQHERGERRPPDRCATDLVVCHQNHSSWRGPPWPALLTTPYERAAVGSSRRTDETASPDVRRPANALNGATCRPSADRGDFRRRGGRTSCLAGSGRPLRRRCRRRVLGVAATRSTVGR